MTRYIVTVDAARCVLRCRQRDLKRLPPFWTEAEGQHEPAEDSADGAVCVLIVSFHTLCARLDSESSGGVLGETATNDRERAGREGADEVGGAGESVVDDHGYARSGR